MTIAQQLKITDFPFEIKDSNGELIYYESSNGYWEKRKYDSNGKLIYHEDSTGYWEKREYDTNGNLIYCENSDRTIIDNRPKTEVQKAIELLEKEGLLVDGKILKN